MCRLLLCILVWTFFHLVSMNGSSLVSDYEVSFKPCTFIHKYEQILCLFIRLEAHTVLSAPPILFIVVGTQNYQQIQETHKVLPACLPFQFCLVLNHFHVSSETSIHMSVV